MIEKYIIVHRTSDPFQADLLGDLLRENGIAARVLGTRHGAAIGVGQHILQRHIEVPQSQAGAATDFIESFFEGDGADLLREQAGLELDNEEEPEDPDAGEVDELSPATPAQSRPLRPLFAAGACLLLFGGSHLYARRPWTTLVLAAGQVFALVSIGSMQWSTVATGLVMSGMIFFLELSGGQIAVRAWNRGVRVAPLRQVATGVVFVALAGAIGALLGPHIPAPKRQPERTGPMQQMEMPQQQPSW